MELTTSSSDEDKKKNGSVWAQPVVRGVRYTCHCGSSNFAP